MLPEDTKPEQVMSLDKFIKEVKNEQGTKNATISATSSPSLRVRSPKPFTLKL